MLNRCVSRRSRQAGRLRRGGGGGAAARRSGVHPRRCPPPPTHPWFPSLCCRGVALEGLGRFDEAIRDYRSVLAAAPDDPSAWNNLGNSSAGGCGVWCGGGRVCVWGGGGRGQRRRREVAEARCTPTPPHPPHPPLAGLGRWQEAADCYGRAARLAPGFSFASANQALAWYQLGQDAPAVRQMRCVLSCHPAWTACTAPCIPPPPPPSHTHPPTHTSTPHAHPSHPYACSTLLRKYPYFDDMHAALAAALWEGGQAGPAEEEWGRVRDPRYRDRAWLRADRRWPPRLVGGLEAFLDLRAAPALPAAPSS